MIDTEIQDETKSKNRVQNMGEVYTPRFIVDIMTGLEGIAEKSRELTSKWLEPSCGNGNFIAKILEDKLYIVLRISKSQEEFDLNTVKSVCSIYGIDILHDNIVETKQRMITIIENAYTQSGYLLDNQIIKVISYILDRNIILGNVLENKMASILEASRKKRKNSIVIEFKLDLIVNEWEFTGENVKRRSFRLSDLDIELNMEYQGINYRKLNMLADIEEEDLQL